MEHAGLFQSFLKGDKTSHQESGLGGGSVDVVRRKFSHDGLNPPPFDDVTRAPQLDRSVVFKENYPWVVGNSVSLSLHLCHIIKKSLPIGPKVRIADPEVRLTAPVNLYEADFVENHCVVAVSSSGSLIHATVGSTGGSGALRTKRSGWAA